MDGPDQTQSIKLPEEMNSHEQWRFSRPPERRKLTSRIKQTNWTEEENPKRGEGKDKGKEGLLLTRSTSRRRVTLLVQPRRSSSSNSGLVYIPSQLSYPTTIQFVIDR